MGRKKFSSPTLSVKLTASQRDEAIKSASGGCLIADAIKAQYPQFSGVTVDMATIRVSDRDAGVRYTYLTPPVAQHVLLAFDQGWPNPTESVIVKRAVKITPIKAPSVRSEVERSARLEELKAKEREGTISGHERSVLTKMRNRPPRKTNPGPSEVGHDRDGHTVVHGGRPIPHGRAHPNLLRGRDRHFGAKLADPGEAFHEAVEAAVAERIAAQNGET